MTTIRAAGLLLTLTLTACAARSTQPAKPADATPAPSAVATLPPETLRQSPTPAPGDEVELRGTVSYLQRVALPPQAVLTIELVADQKGPPRILVTQHVATNGAQVPLHFSLRIPSNVAADSRLALQARIVVDGAARFVTKGRVPVSRTAAARPIEIILQPVN